MKKKNTSLPSILFHRICNWKSASLKIQDHHVFVLMPFCTMPFYIDQHKRHARKKRKRHKYHQWGGGTKSQNTMHCVSWDGPWQCGIQLVLISSGKRPKLIFLWPHWVGICPTGLESWVQETLILQVEENRSLLGVGETIKAEKTPLLLNWSLWDNSHCGWA